MSSHSVFEPSRRAVIGSGLGLMAAAVIGQTTPAEAAQAGESVPPGFPPSIDLHRRVIRNWDETVVTEPLWRSTVQTPEEAVEVVAWAVAQGYQVRPEGTVHSWTPLVIDPAASQESKVLVVDTSRLNAISMEGTDRVRVQAGASMESLLAFLSEQGRSLVGAPAPGIVTVGGVLAINGHGSNVLKPDEAAPPGATYGSVSNMVVELTAIVSDGATYRARTFDRTDPQAGALLVSLGRTLITEVVLQTVPNYNLRCRNRTDIAQERLFAAPDQADEDSLAALLDRHGRVGLIWFAHTRYPWIQLWDVSPKKPLPSRRVTSPYNYPFADSVPREIALLIGTVTAGAWHLTPTLTKAQAEAVRFGLTATGARDMWGEAKNFINFVRPTTLRVSAGSHVVLTRRGDVQRVVHEFTQHYLDLIDQFKAKGLYPANNTCEIRITGLDDPADLGIPGAQTALLSGLAPDPDRPELDTAVWLDVLNLPGSPGTNELFSSLENWFVELPSDLGVARPEWSKRFATTTQGSWTDDEIMRAWIPGQVPGWLKATQVLDDLDPAGVFRNSFHDRLMPN